MKKLSIYCFSLLMASPLCAWAQAEEDAADDAVVATRIRPVKKVEETRIIKGCVKAQKDKQPLAGVLVQSVAGDGYSGLTEEDGTFEVKVPLYSSAVTITIPGYSTIRVGLNRSGDLGEILMMSDAFQSLYCEDDNILNVACMGNQEYTSARNITTEIGTRLGANVHTVARSGALAVGSYMTIGGVNSFQSNAQPLVVLDGVIVDQQYARETLHTGYYNDILTNLNPTDIANVEVLSNGTALYGAKGANGVILITTKRNTSQATRIDASVSLGVEMLPKMYRVMNARQFKSYASGLLESTGTDVKSYKFLDPDVKYWGPKYANDTDWSDQVYRQALLQNYSLSIQGGGDVAGYMLSVGYTLDNSVLNEQNLNRLNVRFNTDIKIAKPFSVRFDAAYTNQTRKMQDIGAPEGYDEKSITSTNFLALAKSPMLSPYSYVEGAIRKQHFDVDDEDYLDEVRELSKANYRLANPAAITHYGTAENKNYFDNSYVNIAFTPKYQVNKHLFISSMFSFTNLNANEKYYVPMSGVPSYCVAALHNRVMENEIGSQFGKQSTVNSDTKIDWGNSYKAHSIHLQGGFRFINESYSLNTQHGYNTGNDKTPFLDNTIEKQSAGINERWANMTWYGQAQYNYANRYYLQGDLAMDTNSQFGREAKGGVKCAGVVWGIFPSLQAGWVVSNEKFFNAKGIDYLKFTTGFNMSGNDSHVYDASRTYFASRQLLNSIPGLTLANIGNSELQWEVTKRFNLGIEANLLNNRLGFRFNYFHSWTDHLLMLQQLGYLSGLDYNWSNGGAMTNQGYDATVTALLLNRKDWSWSVGASVGHYVNTLTQLPDNKQYSDTHVLGATVRSQIGHSINSFYGYRTNGVYATTEEAAAAGLKIVDETGMATAFGAGDMRFVDMNKDGIINEKDRTFIGDATPDIYGNLFTSVSWKHLTLDVNFNYSVGGDVYNYMRQQLESGSRFMNQTTAMLARWQAEGQQTSIPKATYGDPMGNARFSDRWIEDGSYLRLKTLTLSYKLPISNTYIQGISVWAQANNLFTVTRYLGTDPEFSMSNNVLSQGIDRGLLSQGRSVHLGVKINL